VGSLFAVGAVLAAAGLYTAVGRPQVAGLDLGPERELLYVTGASVAAAGVIGSLVLVPFGSNVFAHLAGYVVGSRCRSSVCSQTEPPVAEAVEKKRRQFSSSVVGRGPPARLASVSGPVASRRREVAVGAELVDRRHAVVDRERVLRRANLPHERRDIFQPPFEHE